MYNKNIQYGFLILEHIKNMPKGPREIAREEELDYSWVGNIGCKLRKAGLIESTSKHRRGTVKWRPAKSRITMQEVIDAVESKITKEKRAKNTPLSSFKSLKYIVSLDKYHEETTVV